MLTTRVRALILAILGTCAPMALHAQKELVLPMTFDTIEPDGVSRARVVLQMVFPVVGQCSWSDRFLAPRSNGTRRHMGQDIMASKMRQLVAAFDGVIFLSKGGTHNTIHLRGDNGWSASYMHVNNDTPGTDDGLGSDQFAFAPGLESGSRVTEGQLIGYVGDSGNAENTAPHLHFELACCNPWATVNAAPSLRAASKLKAPARTEPLPPEMQANPALEPIAGPNGLTIRNEEICIEGVVEKSDPVKHDLIVISEAITMHDGIRIPLSPARRKRVAVRRGTMVGSMAAEPTTVAFEDIQAGWRICAVGRHLGVGSVLPSRQIVLEVPTEPIPPPADEQTNPSVPNGDTPGTDPTGGQ